MTKKRNVFRMADEDIQTILRLHSMNPDATPEEILEFTRFEVTPGTVKNIWKCGSVEAYKEYRERNRIAQKEYSERKRKEAEEAKAAVQEELLPQTDTPSEITAEQISEAVNLLQEEQAKLDSPEEPAESELERMFRKYLYSSDEQYGDKTIMQQMTCAVIGIGALRSELHKEFIGKEKEETFGKRVTDLLTIMLETMTVIADQQTKMLPLLERLVDEWEGNAKNKEEQA